MFRERRTSRSRRISSPALSLLLLLSLLLASLCPFYAAEGAPPLSVWSGESAASFPEGSGQKTDPYLISTPEQLAYLAETVGNGNSYSGTYFRLTADLALNDTANFGNWQDNPPQRQWTPIGGYVALSISSEPAYNKAVESGDQLYLRSENGYQPADRYVQNAIYYRLTAFSGNFDGNGHSISGIYHSSDAIGVGLFGGCKDATVSNLTIDHAFISGESEVGGLIGRLDSENGCQITHCQITADIYAGGAYAGGAVGRISGSSSASMVLTDCNYSGNLTAEDMVGGIVGAIQASSAAKFQIERCVNNGYVTASTAAGGIVGQLSGTGTILSAVCNGAISADRSAGGIIGEINSSVGYITVSDCKNNASVLGQQSVGGIAGACKAESESGSDGHQISPDLGDQSGGIVIELLSCSNLGDLYAAESAGGIAGSCTISGSAKLNLIGCKNSASVNGDQKIGGITGSLSAESGVLTVGSNENYGAVTCNRFSGGIVGSALSSAELNIYRCFSYASVTAVENDAGGIAGALTVSGDGKLLMEESCTNGTIKATGHVGGIAGSLRTESEIARCTLTNCFSSALLTAQENTGGIAGSMEAQNGQTVISNCLFYGSFTSGCKLSGGIAAYAHAESPEATVQIMQCYYPQNSASRPALLYGGKGTELCQSSNGLSEEALKNSEQLMGLDFSAVWTTDTSETGYPVLRSVDFVWEIFHYTVSGKSASVLSYHSRSDIAVIPSKLGGVSVTTVADSAFMDSSVVKVVLPDSLTTIGESAFANCKQLTAVTLSPSLRTVGAGAFKNCSALQIKRCVIPLNDLYVGSDNEPFEALTTELPVNLQIEYNYENGAAAAKGSTLSCYRGDYYLIDPPSITGYEADSEALTGICRDNQKIHVIYRLGSYQLTIRYLFTDNSSAASDYSATYRYGESYSISAPDIHGFIPEQAVTEGLMGGEDIVLTVYYSEQLRNDLEGSSKNAPLILLLICSLMVLICCIGYFIFRYRSQTPQEDEDNNFHDLLKPRF